MKKGIIAVDQDYVLAKLTEKWLKYYNTIFNDNFNINSNRSPHFCKWVMNVAKYIKMLKLL